MYFKFHRVHFRANSALLPKECFIVGLKHYLQCNKALFVGNKAQFPTCPSAGARGTHASPTNHPSRCRLIACAVLSDQSPQPT